MNVATWGRGGGVAAYKQIVTPCEVIKKNQTETLKVTYKLIIAIIRQWS